MRSRRDGRRFPHGNQRAIGAGGHFRALICGLLAVDDDEPGLVGGRRTGARLRHDHLRRCRLARSYGTLPQRLQTLQGYRSGRLLLGTSLFEHLDQ
jgi:hypothetical protein